MHSDDALTDLLEKINPRTQALVKGEVVDVKPVSHWEYSNVIPGNTADLRIERYLSDHPPFATQDRDWDRGKSRMQRAYPVAAYVIDNIRIWRVMRLRGKGLKPGQEIGLVMGIPQVVRVKGRMRRLWSVLW